MYEIISYFIDYLKHNKRVSEHTIIAYSRDLDDMASWLSRNAEINKLDNLDHRHLRSFLADLYHTRQASSIARTLSAIRSFLKYCVKNGHLKTSPADLIISPKIPQRLPSGLSVDEAFTICDEKFSLTQLSARDEAIVELLYATGIRVSEVCGLNCGDVDLGGMVVTVVGKGDKERVVPFHEKCATKLRAWILERNNLLPQKILGADAPFFLGTKGCRLNDRVLRKMLERCGNKAQMQGSLYPHRFRHAFGTHLLEGGADLRAIQEFLGHASISTTQQYTNVNLTHLMRVYDTAHPHSKKRAPTNRLPKLGSS